MTIWIVFHIWAHETKEVEGVFLNKANAYDVAEKRNCGLSEQQTHYEWFDVENFEVEDATFGVK